MKSYLHIHSTKLYGITRIELFFMKKKAIKKRCFFVKKNITQFLFKMPYVGLSEIQRARFIGLPEQSKS